MFVKRSEQSESVVLEQQWNNYLRFCCCQLGKEPPIQFYPRLRGRWKWVKVTDALKKERHLVSIFIEILGHKIQFLFSRRVLISTALIHAGKILFYLKLQNVLCFSAARKRDSEGITKQYPDKIPVSVHMYFNSLWTNISHSVYILLVARCHI